MENTTNELIKLVKERLKYPIVTIYTIILIVYNWDVLAIFFLSNKNIEDRIAYINKEFEGETWLRILCPLIKALVISILAPLLMWLLDWVLNKVTTERTKLRDKKTLNLVEIKEQLALTEFRIQQAKNGNVSEIAQQKKVDDLTEALKKQQENYESQIQVATKTLTDQKNTYEKIIGELNDQISNLLGRVEYYSNLSGDNISKSDKFINNLVKDTVVSELLVKSILVSIPTNDSIILSMIKSDLARKGLIFTTNEVLLAIRHLVTTGLIEVKNDVEIILTRRGRTVKNSFKDQIT